MGAVTKAKSKPIKKTTKKINVEDKKGNKHILKATVFSVSSAEIQKAQSSQLLDDDVESVGLSGRVLEPPLPLMELSLLPEVSTELPQITKALATGISGFGWQLGLRSDLTPELEAKFKEEIKKEHDLATSLLRHPNPKVSLVGLAKQMQQERAITGNAYWELIPSPTDSRMYSCIGRVSASSVRITKADRTFTRVPESFVRSDFTIGKKFFMERLRRFVQIKGRKKVFFKEFGDPRVIDKRTGEIADESLPRKFRANELFHWLIQSTRDTPYGLPELTSNIISIKGQRASSEANIVTLMNNNVPSFCVLANGGQLTDGSVSRIREFVDTQIKGSSNYSKWLVLEGESSHDGLSSPSNMKIEIVPLTGSQHQDQLWQQYDENNAKKLRRNFRIAPILVGASENYDRATAQVSEKLTEKYVFNPERQEFDRSINRILLSQGVRFWEFKSHSPNVTNDEDLVKILTGGERSGALTPNRATLILEDILGIKLPPYAKSEFFDPDLPQTINVGLLMHRAAKANQNGTMEPQGQMPGVRTSSLPVDPETLVRKMLEKPAEYVEELMSISDELEKQLDIESHGSEREDIDGCC